MQLQPCATSVKSLTWPISPHLTDVPALQEDHKVQNGIGLYSESLFVLKFL